MDSSGRDSRTTSNHMELKLILPNEVAYISNDAGSSRHCLLEYTSIVLVAPTLY